MGGRRGEAGGHHFELVGGGRARSVHEYTSFVAELATKQTFDGQRTSRHEKREQFVVAQLASAAVLRVVASVAPAHDAEVIVHAQLIIVVVVLVENVVVVVFVVVVLVVVCFGDYVGRVDVVVVADEAVIVEALVFVVFEFDFARLFAPTVPDFVVETGARTHGYGLELFGLLGGVEEARVWRYHVALQVHRLTLRFGLFESLLHLLFGVYGGQSEHEQVHGRG